MWSALRRGTGIACIRLAFQPIQHRKLDEDRISNPIVRDTDSGIDRVAKIFDRDENGTISGEAAFISIFGFTGGFIGAMYGGLAQSRIANFNFRESNEAVLYYSNKAASRELLDATTIGFAKGVVKWGIRYAIFCTSFAALSTIFTRFRGEFGILEYSSAGLVTGAIYKFGLGPKGMFSGGFFGVLLGTFAGVLIYVSTKLTGATMDDTYQLLKSYYETKDLNFHAAHRHTEEPDIIIEMYYPDGRDSMKHNLDKLEDIQSASELKYNKNILPKQSNESNKIVNTKSEQK